MHDYPYVLFSSAPIGPIAEEALRLARYEPTLVVDDPNLTVDQQLYIIEEQKPTFILVVGYGAILKQIVLDSVAGQALNIHPSLLPQYRGPAPVVQTILDGVRETGVTLMQIDAKMDHGPILAQEEMILRGDETPDELYKLLTRRGVDLFLNCIDDYLEDRLEPYPQNHLEASITHFVKKEDGELDFGKSPELLEREIRAYQGWPRSFTFYNGKRLIVDKAHLEEGKLRFEKVQPENGKVMGVKEFCAGQRISEPALYEALGLA